ncbi:hypothetical protein ACH5RR_006418 [Cinchona calisaya]|uniref:Uncharacterized protein n=1 Tax=Cinchona calisaya TaxID=153742 RepID=A0ABD3ANY2_9GENT
MGSPLGSTLSTNMAGFVDGSSARRQVSYLDTLPIYVKELIAGGAAGGFAKTVVAPLERTKILLQVVDPRQSLHNSVGHIYPQPAYTGIRNVIQSVYTEGGVRALYRGVGPTLIGILPYAGLKFYIYEELKRHVPEEHQTSIMMRLSCGALAVAVRKLSVNEKNIHDAADRAKKKRMSHFSKFSHLPSFVRRGAKMVNARMVAVGNKTLRRAVPL